MLIDLSDRVRADQIRRQLASIVESSDDAIISKDFNGIITSWNNGARQVFGYTADEVIGKPITILMPPDRYDEETDILGRIRRGERIDHYETIRQRKDGTLLNILADRVAHAQSRGSDHRRFEDRARHHRAQTCRSQAGDADPRVASPHQEPVRGRAGGGVEKLRRQAHSRRCRKHRPRSPAFAGANALAAGSSGNGREPNCWIWSATRCAPFASRVSISGPTVMLNPQAAQNFALALHELTTNAAKYGALSVASGGREH